MKAAFILSPKKLPSGWPMVVQILWVGMITPSTLPKGLRKQKWNLPTCIDNLYVNYLKGKEGVFRGCFFSFYEDDIG